MTRPWLPSPSEGIKTGTLPARKALVQLPVKPQRVGPPPKRKPPKKR